VEARIASDNCSIIGWKESSYIYSCGARPGPNRLVKKDNPASQCKCNEKIFALSTLIFIPTSTAQTALTISSLLIELSFLVIQFFMCSTMAHLTLSEDEKILNSEEILGYRFNDRVRLRQALQLADSVHRDGNKHLALLGDAVIKLILVKEGLVHHATRGK
jgi:hypothetical protein